MKGIRLLLLFLVATGAIAQEVQFDLLLKGGWVIDHKNQINTPMDVAILDKKVARVAESIPASQAKKMIDVTGLFVTPGLIDVHAHVFVGDKPGKFAGGFSSVSPDDFSFRSGVTTVVDAGTSGWRNFPHFKYTVIDQSRTRVLAFLNIAGSGMQGQYYEQDLADMDAERTARMIQKYPGIIVGTKVGHYQGTERAPLQRALEAGEIAQVPLLVECHLPEYGLDELLDRMRAGDILTHSFGKVSDRTSVVDENGKVKSYVLEARDKGIRFDVGHGGGSFHFSEAVPALDQGLFPDSFGTDLHRFSMNAGMKDMLNIMSKYLNMGMPLEEVIFRATWNSAQSIKRPDLGHLSPGAEADLVVLRVREGTFGFVDAGGYRLEGDRKLEAELTLRAGKVAWDLNGLSALKLNK